MSAAFENFTLYYAKSLAENEAAQAVLKITNGDGIKLIYCIPKQFQKRTTDTSNALALDKTSPDSGTAGSFVEIRFSQERESAPAVNVLKTLLDMFYQFTDDTVFRKGRFGLLNDDNPELNATPDETAGYKFIKFEQDPNPDETALNKYTVLIEFEGDHNILQAFA